jgi:hypothetical protein
MHLEAIMTTRRAFTIAAAYASTLIGQAGLAGQGRGNEDRHNHGSTSADDFAREVYELHDYLSAWLKGEVPRNDSKPERLAHVLADDFIVVHPNGRHSSKAEAVQGFGSAWREKPASYALRVADVETRLIGDGICLATYKEWHQGEPGRGRVAAAVLRRRAGGDGIEWLFLQETLAPHVEQEPNA